MKLKYLKQLEDNKPELGAPHKEPQDMGLMGNVVYIGVTLLTKSRTS